MSGTPLRTTDPQDVPPACGSRYTLRPRRLGRSRNATPARTAPCCFMYTRCGAGDLVAGTPHGAQEAGAVSAPWQTPSDGPPRANWSQVHPAGMSPRAPLGPRSCLGYTLRKGSGPLTDLVSGTPPAARHPLVGRVWSGTQQKSLLIAPARGNEPSGQRTIQGHSHGLPARPVARPIHHHIALPPDSSHARRTAHGRASRSAWYSQPESLRRNEFRDVCLVDGEPRPWQVRSASDPARCERYPSALQVLACPLDPSHLVIRA